MAAMRDSETRGRPRLPVLEFWSCCCSTLIWSVEFKRPVLVLVSARKEILVWLFSVYRSRIVGGCKIPANPTDYSESLTILFKRVGLIYTHKSNF